MTRLPRSRLPDEAVARINAARAAGKRTGRRRARRAATADQRAQHAHKIRQLANERPAGRPV